MEIKDRITQQEKAKIKKVKKKKEHLSERELRELMGEFDQRLERKKGALRRK